MELSYIELHDDELPDHFVTCFNLEELTLYRHAIDVYAEKNPQHHFDIDTSGRWNISRNLALLCYDRDELAEFWEIFEEIKACGPAS